MAAADARADIEARTGNGDADQHDLLQRRQHGEAGLAQTMTILSAKSQRTASDIQRRNHRAWLGSRGRVTVDIKLFDLSQFEKSLGEWRKCLLYMGE